MTSPIKAASHALEDALASLAQGAVVDEGERAELLQLVDQARSALAPPRAAFLDIIFSAQNFTAAALARDIGIFDVFGSQPGTELSLDEIASKAKGDKILIMRLLRVMSAHRLFQETGQDTFKSSALAATLVSTSPSGLALSHYYGHLKVYAALGDYFRANDYANPSDAFNGPWQFAHNTSKHYFDWLQDFPDRQRSFNASMKLNRLYRAQNWFDFFPVMERLQTSRDKVAFVDIGGGTGHDITAFRAEYPPSALTGRFVLQDLPAVIGNISGPLPVGVEAAGYDMFTPQPTKGARAYYLRTVLHDWPDQQAIQILGNIRKAMSSDSILLVNENVLPPTNVPRVRAGIDMIMMSCFSALERTEDQWIRLIEAGGFKLARVWRPTREYIEPACLFEASPILSSQM